MNEKCVFVAIILLHIATALHGKTATFKVQVQNEGKVLTEVVKINAARRTEIFQILSPDGSEEAKIVHDFRKKLTMISLPEKQVCYLSKLSDSLPSPSRLVRAFKKAAPINHSNLEKLKTRMEVKGLFQNQTELGISMRRQCQDFVIYRIEPAEGLVSITTLSDEGTEDDHGRFRRNCGTLCEMVEECYPVPCGNGVCYECQEVEVCNPINCY